MRTARDPEAAGAAARLTAGAERMDEQALASLRSAMRKDLDLPGAFPTGAGIQMVAQGDQALGFALVCEAVYVQLYTRGRPRPSSPIWKARSRSTTRACGSTSCARRLRVREVLAGTAGDRVVAVRR